MDQNTLKQFSKELICAICLEQLKNPKLLSCGHTLCADPCLKGLIDQNYGSRDLRCPLCRTQGVEPKHGHLNVVLDVGVESFPDNLTAKAFLGLHSEMKRKDSWIKIHTSHKAFSLYIISKVYYLLHHLQTYVLMFRCCCPINHSQRCH